ncbi:leucine rich repeat protein bspa family [Entamoeba histolytica]|uniref:Leucine rich repeat protein bspa family n=1 Tax=Entamoeba histolytica TaxID=5759 RepID=A0A175JZU9_ENTHI|nr:leucine rich repeat protein bspa family [Entamoeba histolytica]
MKLGYNEIMIVSKYFEDINDFINLEMGIKRFEGNMERFHFNPIPLNQYSRKLFPNIETFHIYNKEDEVFKDGRIIKYVIWYKVEYSRYLEEKEEGNICKNIEYTKEDIKNYGNTIPIEVNSLGEYCFYGLKSINIPSTISKIGNNNFSNKLLTSITVDNLKFISKERIFMNEPALLSIQTPRDIQQINKKKVIRRNINEFIIPTTITKLTDECFKECYSLTSTNIPITVSKIGSYCFSYCSSLKSINIPLSVNVIENYCFDGCLSLTSVTIPSSIHSLGDNCFRGCSTLKSINIPKTVSKLGNGCFERCTSLSLINIPRGIKEIGGGCFYECLSLTSMNIPTTISKIGGTCFNGCKLLKNINIKNLQFISGNRIFLNEPILLSIRTPENIKEINRNEIKQRDINEFIIPTTITKLTDECFSGCTSLRSFNIPTTVNELGSYCFCGCSSLKSIIIPSTVSIIGDECFKGCSSLTSVTKTLKESNEENTKCVLV